MDHKAIAGTGLHGQGHTRHGSDGSESRRTFGAMAHIRCMASATRSRGERSIGPDQFGIRQRTLGKNTKTNRHKNLGMAEAPLPVAAINGRAAPLGGRERHGPPGEAFVYGTPISTYRLKPLHKAIKEKVTSMDTLSINLF